MIMFFFGAEHFQAFSTKLTKKILLAVARLVFPTFNSNNQTAAAAAAVN